MTSTKEKYQFTSIDDAIKIIASGGMLIVVDDESRENE
jgi:3,4-dihydroxy-2-butanone 4-phosphate synthase